MEDTTAARQAVTGLDSDQILRASIRSVNAMSHETVSQVEAMAEGAIALLSSPKVIEKLEFVAAMLAAIKRASVELEERINFEADSVGERHIDTDRIQNLGQFDTLIRRAAGGR